jgi:hypothetical protein
MPGRGEVTTGTGGLRGCVGGVCILGEGGGDVVAWGDSQVIGGGEGGGVGGGGLALALEGGRQGGAVIETDVSGNTPLGMIWGRGM